MGVGRLDRQLAAHGHRIARIDAEVDDGRFELAGVDARPPQRSEEHTSELQSLMRISYAVFCLKKKTNIYTLHRHVITIHKRTLVSFKSYTQGLSTLTTDILDHSPILNDT